MRTVLLASLRTHTRRYVAAVLAVTIGVGFVVATNAIASAARDGMVAGVALPYDDADAVVTDLSGAEAVTLVDRAARAGDSAAVLGWTMQPVRGSRVSDRVDVGAIADDPVLRWQVVEEGRFPRGPGEAVADVNAAKSEGVGVGDPLTVGAGSRAVEVTVVGLVDSPSASVGATLYLPWSEVTAWSQTLYVDSVAYRGAGPEELSGVPGTVRDVDEFVEDRSTELSQGVNVLAYVLLLFAAIALTVAVLVIANTFSILFAQRTRDFALLRCVGATRRQVLRSVRVEALLLGAVSSVVGVVAGAGLGLGLVALVRELSPRAPLGAVSFSPAWLAAALVTGLVVTLLAAWLPTRKVVRVSPLAALRPDQDVDVHTAAGRLRIGLGLALVVGGVGLLAASVAVTSVAPMLAGGIASFSGLLLLGPVLVPALIRLGGGALGRVGGTTARLATGNAVRNPRRTAATTASLLVGVTLTTAVLTGLATARGSIDGEMATQHPVDLTLTATGDPLPTTLVGDVRATPDVAAAVAVEGVRAEVSHGVGDLRVLTVPDDAGTVTHAALPRPRPGEIWLPYDVAPDARRVAVTVGGRDVTLRVRLGEGWDLAGLVAPATLARLGDPAPQAVWVRAGGGADAEDVAGDLEALAVNVDAELGNGLAQRAYVTLQLDVLTGAVVGLLGIAVVIALVGIGNTLGLSVLERGREHSLLRALGLTRRQLRATLATEAVLLSVVATVLGTAVGVAYAWVGNEAMVRPLVDDSPMVLPVRQLALVVVVAGLAGLASCLLPARRAARVAPAAGLATD
ncbi:FtsX-like permease family protein [Nocardioides sp. SYSU D00038]|uniref:FtsX-like permease family protein n=1 Tax=Nocardioides sp. SYSU D00038 TaxID=2812554 RepID=UPI001967FFEE|nr:FtsX-like permease family protein [Nocardioides sp. SYSU D00038]